MKDAIESAAAMFVEDLPEKEDTSVGEFGGKLSGGQAWCRMQRL